MRAEAPRLGVARKITVVDQGFYNNAGFSNYDPMLKFYAELAGHRGLAVSVVHDAGSVAIGDAVASCDPQALAALHAAAHLHTLVSDQDCRLARVTAVTP